MTHEKRCVFWRDPKHCCCFLSPLHYYRDDNDSALGYE